VSESLRARLARGWGRAGLLSIALSGLLAVTGALAVIFYRPYGPDVRAQLGHGHWRLRVGLASALHWTHAGAAIAVVAAVLALILLARPWHRGGPVGRGRLLALALATAAFVGTGYLVPWERLLPWSPAVGSNLARPMPLGQQGPFVELVGVNMRYDDAQFTLLRRRFGARATGRLYYAHVLGLPLITALGVLSLRRRKG
jgi:hypothetical protein